MTTAGRLLLVKSVMAPLTIFFMSCIDVPVTIKHQVIKYLRHCLRRGSDLEDKTPASVAWTTVCRSRGSRSQGHLSAQYNSHAKKPPQILQ